MNTLKPEEMTNVKKILFSTDFSKTSEKAKNMAGYLKDRLGCHLDIVHVYDPAALMMPVPYGALPGVDQWVDEHFASFKDRGRSALDDLCPELGSGCSGAFLEGKPGPAVVEYAEENDIDLIVMGTHGHNGVNRLLMGSVAEYVLRHTPCPVLTVKSDEA